MKAYKELEASFKRLNDVHGALSMLHWDFAAMMPEGSSHVRSEQLATLSAIAHDIITDEKLGDLISKAKSTSKKLDPWQKSNLDQMEKSYIHSNCLDKDLVIAISRAGSECEMVWRETKPRGDFKTFLPYLKKVVNLAKEASEVKAEALNLSKYDALLDQYDEGCRKPKLDKIFSELKTFLPPFLEQVLEKQKRRKVIPINGKFPINKQEELGKFLIKKIGFDFNKGRLDISAHPFCGGVPGDVRITTRYNESDFSSSLMGVIHETGHAMYEMGLPEKWTSQPVGGALGMSMHESQSLLMEMQMGRSDEFFKFILPHAKKSFGVSGKAWTVDNLRNVYCEVQRSFIRVDADEVTYPLHVILRYEIEKEIIENNFKIDDLPDIWNQKMKKYLGITPKNHGEGCMQDIHWTDGTFGYFPTYTLGAILAAQFFAQAKKDVKGLLPNIAKGNFKPLIGWLGKNIHSKASIYTTDELVKKVTGKAIDVNIFKKHLESRYLNN